MLQSPAGNVRFYPAIKIMYNFYIDLIKSFFTVFFFSINLHNWRNSVITQMDMADATTLSRPGQASYDRTIFFFDGLHKNLIFSCFYFYDSYFV